MATVKEGETIRIHYTGKLEDSTVSDSSKDGVPLEFKVGGREFLKGLEEGVVGMNIGESKTIRIPAKGAYGPHKKEMVFEFHKSRAPQDFDPQVGQQVQMQRADGMLVTVNVVGKSDTSFTMDCNHPLAGKDLTFDIRLVEII